MTATTSKLGADMTDDEIREHFESHAIYALEGYKMYWPEALSFARSLLARQPAAIDKQEANKTFARLLVGAAAKSGNPKAIELAMHLAGVPPCATCGFVNYHCRCAAPLDKGASKPAAPSVAQDERGAFEYAARRLGADLSQTNGIYHDESTQRLRMMWHTAATFCGKARAASTSANVAQGAEAVAWTKGALVVLIDEHKAHDGTVDSFELADSLLEGKPAAPTLSEAEIEGGWHQTFSTNNPYCPCNLKSFTKAVRWAECALTAAQSARGDTQ